MYFLQHISAKKNFAKKVGTRIYLGQDPDPDVFKNIRIRSKKSGFATLSSRNTVIIIFLLQWLPGSPVTGPLLTHSPTPASSSFSTVAEMRRKSKLIFGSATVRYMQRNG
jgi:hypothetical protein